MKTCFSIFFSITAFLFMNGQQSLDSVLKKYNSGDVPYVSVEQLRMFQLDDEVTILDARELEEFEVSHLQDALFVGYDNFDTSKLKNVPNDSKIVVYCSIGIRSENIAEKLQRAGYTNIFNLYGGIFEWKNKNFPVVDLQGNETEKVHAYSKKWSKWLKNGKKIY